MSSVTQYDEFGTGKYEAYEVCLRITARFQLSFDQLQLILCCLLVNLLAFLVQKLGNFWNHFIPECHIFCLVPTLHPRFHVEDQIFLFFHGEMGPRNSCWTRFWRIWSSKRQRQFESGSVYMEAGDPGTCRWGNMWRVTPTIM